MFQKVGYKIPDNVIIDLSKSVPGAIEFVLAEFNTEVFLLLLSISIISRLSDLDGILL